MKNANIIINVCTFTLGATIASAATWGYAKNKYEKLADEEIESVKKTYSINDENGAKSERVANEECAKNHTKRSEVKNLTDYRKKNMDAISKPVNDTHKVIKDNGYDTKVSDREVKNVLDIYEIDKDSYGKDPDYDTATLTYYLDGVLTDELNDQMNETEIGETIGVDILEKLQSRNYESLIDSDYDEYEDEELDIESVFVRNDILSTDYEVTICLRDYYDTKYYY